MQPRLRLNKREVIAMQRLFVGLFLCSLFFAVGGDAQSRDTKESPVWTLEFIKVRPEKYILALDQWTSVREEAKRRGAVLDYHLISNAGILTADHTLPNPISIGFVTEYASAATYLEREKLFASIREHQQSNSPRDMPKLQQEDVCSDELVFMNEPSFGFFRVGDTLVEMVQLVRNEIPEHVNSVFQLKREKR